MISGWKNTLAVFSYAMIISCAAAGTHPSGNDNAGETAASQSPAPNANAPRPSGREPAPVSVFLDTTYTAPTGRTINVSGSGAAAAQSFQAALDSARPGSVIAIDPKTTITGEFTLPKKEGAGWIIIRSAVADNQLPPSGTRITPAHSPVMPKLVTANAAPAIRTAPGAHHYRFIGVEFMVAPEVKINYGLVLLGEGGKEQNSPDLIPHDLIIDRCYVHGNQTGNLRRGVALNSARTSIIDSYVSDCHEIGADSQAVCGWNGPGPFKIVNNFLAGSGENVMFGGADPRIENLVPSDIEFRNNYCLKPLSWNPRDPSYAGIHWSVKNLFELKNSRRVLIEGNTFENNWVDAQSGPSILFTVRNQDGTAPWSTVEDVIFKDNIVRNVAGGVSILGTDDVQPSAPTRRIRIENNLFEAVGGPGLGTNGRLFQLLSGAADITIDHNTGFQTAQVIVADGKPSPGLVYTNNITAPGQYGIFGDSASEGQVTISKYFPDSVIAKNVFAGRPSRLYPPGNFFAATLEEVGFADHAKGDYRLTEKSIYKRAGTDGRDIGCDVTKLRKEK
ncbi:MAG TPA: hypothetical protein VJZ26_12280 [Blastocatellia bacterium]|nr:hypothetical protein [Blastocatellia bacterium]